MTTTVIATGTTLRNISREAPHTTDPRSAKTTALALLEQKRATLDSKREQLRSKMSMAATLSRPPTARTPGAERDLDSAAGSGTKRAREVQEAQDSVVRTPKRAAIEVASVELNEDRDPYRDLLSSRQTDAAKIVEARRIIVSVQDSTTVTDSAGLPTSPHASDLTALDLPKQLLRRSLRLSGQHLAMSPAPAHEPPELADEPTATEGEELAMLEARMMQWCFLNARATHAFEKQTEVVQVCVRFRCSGSVIVGLIE
ncbi:hypothetical protein BC937DRAFT_93856 [Endogone sp. FLAS-F59071]|nr:hypothetical protein BC937DRAFT_93856 [Endogone sp. FLAS-F59071]|eukprot:RUS14426.1 hypothetical protein BC937DRAFT_93856 [Endogone sp. FLAS-F59071]